MGRTRRFLQRCSISLNWTNGFQCSSILCLWSIQGNSKKEESKVFNHTTIFRSWFINWYLCLVYILLYIYYDSLVESPMDFFKSQIQIQIFEQQAKPTEYKPEFNGVIDCAKKVVSKYGIRGFYQGLGPTLLRDAIAVSFYFGVYEMIRRSFLKPGQSYGDVEKLSLMKLFWAGGFAGVVYWLSVYPIDVVKSQMMADSVHPEKRIYKNMIDCAKKIYAKEGPKVFFKGFLPCIIRSFPANAACFICYQKSLQLLM